MESLVSRMIGLATERLVPISMVTLLSGSCPEVDIFAVAGEGSRPLLFCSETETVNAGKLRHIAEQGVFKLYVTAESFHNYQTYLRKNWSRIIADPSLPTVTRTSILSEVVRDVLQSSFSNAQVDSTVRESYRLGAGIVQIINEERVLVGGLAQVLHHDYATFTHSANVACYARCSPSGLGFRQKNNMKSSWEPYFMIWENWRSTNGYCESPAVSNP